MTDKKMADEKVLRRITVGDLTMKERDMLQNYLDSPVSMNYIGYSIFNPRSFLYKIEIYFKPKLRPTEERRNVVEGLMKILSEIAVDL